MHRLARTFALHLNCCGRNTGLVVLKTTKDLDLALQKMKLCDSQHQLLTKSMISRLDFGPLSSN